MCIWGSSVKVYSFLKGRCISQTWIIQNIPQKWCRQVKSNLETVINSHKFWISQDLKKWFLHFFPFRFPCFTSQVLNSALQQLPPAASLKQRLFRGHRREVATSQGQLILLQLGWRGWADLGPVGFSRDVSWENHGIRWYISNKEIWGLENGRTGAEISPLVISGDGGDGFWKPWPNGSFSSMQSQSVRGEPFNLMVSEAASKSTTWFKHWKGPVLLGISSISNLFWLVLCDWGCFQSVEFMH